MVNYCLRTMCCWLLGAGALQAQSETLTIPAGEAWLLSIGQADADLVVAISGGGEDFAVDHPLGMTGPELLVLGPYAAATPVRITATDTEDGTPAQLDLQADRLPANDAALPAYVLLTRAGRLFQQGTADSVAAALQLYGEAQALGTLPARWQYYPQYLAAAVHYFLFDLEAARADLQLIPQGSCAVPDFCYKPALLLQEIDFAQDRYDTVAEALRQQLPVLENGDRSTDYRADLSRLKVNLGISLVLLGERQQSLAYLQEALVIAKELNSRVLLGVAYNGLATYYSRQPGRQLALMEENLVTAREYLRETGEDRLLTYVVTNLAQTYRFLGEYQQAQQVLLETLERVENNVDTSLPTILYLLLGSIYQVVGDWNPAEHFFRLAMNFDTTTGRDDRYYEARNSLGAVLRAKGDVAAASELHQGSYEYYRSGTAPMRLAAATYQLALDHLAQHDLVEARQYFTSLEQMELPIPLSQAMPTFEFERARLVLEEGDLDAARTLLLTLWAREEAADTALADRMELAGLLMQVHAQQGELARAVEYGETLITLASNIRGQLEHLRMGAAWSSRTNRWYEMLVGLLLRQYEESDDQLALERAFTVMENSRARGLMEQRMVAGDLEAPDNDERRRLRRELTEISNIRASLAPDAPSYLRVTEAYYQLLERFQADYVLLDEDAAAEVSVAAARRKLDATTLLVEFICVEESVCQAFVLSDSELKVFAAGSYAEVLALTTEINTALRTPGTDSVALRQQLGGLLLGEVLADPVVAGKTTLLLVADYPLNNLPLAALSIPGNQALVERFSVVTLPSINTYDPATPAPASYPLELAVFADPVFSESAVTPTAAASSGFSGWLDSLDRLRWSSVEARNLETLFASENVRLYTREQATRANLLKPETRNARILHIASHAYFNAGITDLVGIAFSSSPDGEAGGDGGGEAGAETGGAGDFVTLQELFDSQFSSELVVISGCETGQGTYLPGEGSMSLARGFIAQGVSHVISTLWPVSDRASVEFMRVFYDALHNQKLSIKASLQYAQNTLAASSDYADPFYWAPYILTSVR